MPIPVDVDIPVSTSASVYPIGGSSGYDGPWREEKQELTFHYVRVPIIDAWSMSHTLTLQEYTPSCTIAETTVIGWVEASYSIKKTTNNYSVSTSYTQPQKFELDPSPSGPDGTVYGSPTASAGQFGAQGTIWTSEPFIDRKLWQTSDVGTEVSHSVVGTTAAFETNVSGSNGKRNWNWDFMAHWKNYSASWYRGIQYLPYAPDDGWQYIAGVGQPHLNAQRNNLITIPGTYSVGKETNTNMPRLILDHLARLIRNNWLVVIHPSNSGSTYAGIHTADLVGIPSYSENRHSYV